MRDLHTILSDRLLQCCMLAILRSSVCCQLPAMFYLANITSQILDIYAMIACADDHVGLLNLMLFRSGSMCSVMQRSIMQRSIRSFPTRARYCRL